MRRSPSTAPGQGPRSPRRALRLAGLSLATGALAALTAAAIPAASAPAGVQDRVALARTVQFAFVGESPAGGLIVAEVQAPGSAPLVQHLHVAPGTSAADVAALVAARFAAAGAPVVGPAAGGGSFFVAGASFAAVRGTGELNVALAACDGSVTALRVRAPGAERRAARLEVALSTVSPHDGSRRTDHVSTPLDPETGAPGSSARLQEATSALGWTGERKGNDAWRPVRDAGGRDVVGLSAQVVGGDWRIELEL